MQYIYQIFHVPRSMPESNPGPQRSRRMAYQCTIVPRYLAQHQSKGFSLICFKAQWYNFIKLFFNERKWDRNTCQVEYHQLLLTLSKGTSQLALSFYRELQKNEYLVFLSRFRLSLPFSLCLCLYLSLSFCPRLHLSLSFFFMSVWVQLFSPPLTLLLLSMFQNYRTIIFSLVR